MVDLRSINEHNTVKYEEVTYSEHDINGYDYKWVTHVLNNGAEHLTWHSYFTRTV